MSDEGLSRREKVAMLCVFAAIISLGMMGMTAEALSEVEGSGLKDDRTNAYLAMTLFTFLAAAAGAVMAILDVIPIGQACAVGVAFLTNTAAVAIATSSKTGVNPVPALLTWAVELFLIAAFFYLLGTLGGSSKGESKSTTNTPAYNPTPVSMGAPPPPNYQGAPGKP